MKPFTDFHLDFLGRFLIAVGLVPATSKASKQLLIQFSLPQQDRRENRKDRSEKDHGLKKDIEITHNKFSEILSIQV